MTLPGASAAPSQESGTGLGTTAGGGGVSAGRRAGVDASDECIVCMEKESCMALLPCGKICSREKGGGRRAKERSEDEERSTSHTPCSHTQQH